MKVNTNTRSIRCLLVLVAMKGCSSFAPSPFGTLKSTNLSPAERLQQPTACVQRVPIARSPRTMSSLHLFFGNQQESDTKEKELASFPKLATRDIDVKFNGLVGYLSTWSKTFEEDRKGMGLTTPVKVFSELEDDSVPDETIVQREGVRIVFQKTKTGEGYKTKKEEDVAERGEGNEKSGKKKKGPPKEGGVQIQVEKLTSGEVQVRARRCDIDEDTMIKEMSEETIVSQLKKAIQAWSKEYAE